MFSTHVLRFRFGTALTDLQCKCYKTVCDKLVDSPFDSKPPEGFTKKLDSTESQSLEIQNREGQFLSGEWREEYEWKNGEGTRERGLRFFSTRHYWRRSALTKR